MLLMRHEPCRVLKPEAGLSHRSAPSTCTMAPQQYLGAPFMSLAPVPSLQLVKYFLLKLHRQGPIFKLIQGGHADSPLVPSHC